MSRCAKLTYGAFLLALAVPVSGQAQELDVLIRNGTVYDGSGAKPVQKDVGVRDGKIVLFGASKGQTAKTVIDAKGLAVSPGFIDPHTHVPQSVLSVPAPYTMGQNLVQGVTSVVLGPDGGEAPSGIRALMAALKAKGSGLNYFCYVGHNGVRNEVMGHAQRAPTPDELEKMKALVREGMQMGCGGLSAGLMYDPGMFSKPDEIAALAKEVKPFGGTYDSHSRDPVFHFLDSELETAQVGIAAGIPAKLGHLKAVGLDNKGLAKKLVAEVDALRAKGYDIVADVYPYDGAAVQRLAAILVFPDTPPTMRARATGQVVEMLRAIQADPAKMEALKSTTNNGVGGTGFAWVKAVGYQSIRIVNAPGQTELHGKYLSTLAKERGVDPFDLLVDLVLKANGDIIATLGGIDEADLREILKQPWAMISSDGSYVGPDSVYTNSAHPRSTGTFARVLGHYSRDVKLFPLEEAVRKMTSMPAMHMGLAGRGLIKVGYAADIAVFDPKTVTDHSDYLHPEKWSTGVSDVLVNGRFALQGGKVTGETPGTFLTHTVPPAKK